MLIKYLTLLEAAFRVRATVRAAGRQLQEQKARIVGTKHCCCQHVFVCLIVSSIRRGANNWRRHVLWCVSLAHHAATATKQASTTAIAAAFLFCMFLYCTFYTDCVHSMATAAGHSFCTVVRVKISRKRSSFDVHSNSMGFGRIVESCLCVACAKRAGYAKIGIRFVAKKIVTN